MLFYWPIGHPNQIKQCFNKLYFIGKDNKKEKQKLELALHLIFLFYLILQTRDDARQFMKYLHPDLGVGNAVNFLYLI